MKRPIDVWRALTRMAAFLVADLRVERQPIAPPEVADCTLSAFDDVPGVQRERSRLIDFVRDLIRERAR